MIRSPAPAWVDLARGDALPAGEPGPEGAEAPAIDPPYRGENDNAGMMPNLGLSAGGRTAALMPAGPVRGRRLGVTAALILSTTLHAAAFVWLAGNLSLEGMEAETDGIAVEIVFDVPATSASPALAGNDGAADAESAEAVEQAPADTVEPVEATAVTGDTDKAAPVEAIDGGVDEAQPVDEAIAEAVAVAPHKAPEAAEDVESLDPIEAALPAEVPIAEAPDRAEAVAARPVEADAVAAQAIQPVVRPMVEMVEPAPSPVEPAAPAFTPPPPDTATIALLAAPPTVEPVAVGTAEPVDADDLALPASVEAVPEQRPEPMAAVAARPTGVVEAPAKEAQAPRPRAPEPSPKTETKSKQTSAKADFAPRPDGKPAKATREPAAAASAGSNARAAAAPGAEAKYGRALLSHVERHKRYPAAARSAGITGATRLSITIDRSGGLAGAHVAAGSGHQILDQEALAVARRAAPYPRPPEGVGGSTFSFAVTLRFAR